MNRLLCGALAVAAVGLSFSCSKEEIKNSGYDPGVAEYDQTRYLKVVLANPGTGTKADQSFDAGETGENEIKDIRFVFYDRDGNRTSNVVSVTGSDIPAGNTGTGSVNTILEKTLPVEITQGTKLPAYVMCYVNSLVPGELEADSFTTIYNAYRKRVKGDDDSFPMNNSSYYGSDVVSGKAEARILATPIPQGAFGATTKDAATIKIYVERYAAKVKLTMPDESAIIAYPIGDRTLKFTPTGWGINAIDKQMFLVKHYLNNEDETVADMNNRLGSGWWNDADNHRSYWACSPGYYTRNYPEVSDDITDPGKDEKADYDMDYITYESLQSDDNKMSNTFRYVRESTVPAELFSPTEDGLPAVKNPKATLPSIIIAGKYKIDDQQEGTDFFIFGGELCVKKEGLMTKMLKNQRILYSNETGTERLLNANSFEIKHPSLDVRGAIKVPGRYVTLQIKSLENTDLYFLKEGTYQKVTTENLNEVNRLLMTSVGYAESYIGGMAYFAVPIKHLRWYQNDNPHKGMSISSKNWDWTMVRTGDFGIVRNHVYDVVIEKIEGRATGLYSPKQPLVPPTDITSYNVEYEVNTLNWAVVPTQNETL